MFSGTVAQIVVYQLMPKPNQLISSLELKDMLKPVKVGLKDCFKAG
jgi:hypothetical protein